MSIRVKLLGVRGSLPVHGAAYAEFGGATSCVLLRAGDETVILDAGSGLSAAEVHAFSLGSRCSLLLSHPHADHLLGFPGFSPLYDPAFACDIYAKTRHGRDARAQIEALMAPPLWPVTPDVMGAALRFFDVPDHFALGSVQVDAMALAHPGGCTAYRITHEDASVVYATDYEPEGDAEDFIRFAKGASLLLLDGQYLAEESARTKGFGHLTLPRSAAIAAASGAKAVRLIHHDPGRTDAQLRALEQDIQQTYPHIRFGRAGEEIML